VTYGGSDGISKQYKTKSIRTQYGHEKNDTATCSYSKRKT